MAWAEAYLRTKWHLKLNPSSHLAIIDMGRKLGVLCPIQGERVPV